MPRSWASQNGKLHWQRTRAGPLKSPWLLCSMLLQATLGGNVKCNAVGMETRWFDFRRRTSSAMFCDITVSRSIRMPCDGRPNARTAGLSKSAGSLKKFIPIHSLRMCADGRGSGRKVGSPGMLQGSKGCTRWKFV